MNIDYFKEILYIIGLPNNSASDVIQKLFLFIILIASTWVFPIGILYLLNLKRFSNFLSFSHQFFISLHDLKLR